MNAASVDNTKYMNRSLEAQPVQQSNDDFLTIREHEEIEHKNKNVSPYLDANQAGIRKKSINQANIKNAIMRK